MKHIACIFIILTAAVLCQQKVFCQERDNDRDATGSKVKEIIDQYEGTKDVKTFKAGSFILNIMRKAGSRDHSNRFLRHLDNMTIMSARRADEPVRESISICLDNILDNGYIKAIEENEKGETTSVWCRYATGTEDTVSEIAIYDRSIPFIILMEGMFPAEELKDAAPPETGHMESPDLQRL